MFDNQSMATLLEAFLAESEEGLTAAEEALLVLERAPEDGEALAAVFRAVHSLKGNSGIFEFEAITRVAHAMEDLLERLRDGRTVVSNGIITVLLEAVDVLRGLLFATDRGRALTLRELALLEQLGETDGAAESLAGGPVQTLTHRTRSTLRIDLGKLDRLLDLSGEIGIARGRLAQLLTDPKVSARTRVEALRDADHLHFELQELVMKLRMVPVGPTFRQFQRIVRDTARSLGKEAELRIEGDDVEVDMSVVEHLRDPLMHMVRNSVGHGIELPEVRKAAGKPEAGTLVLRSFREAGTIVIELTDDGGGIDRERVLARAREHGLAGEAEELIFHPGFSTADSVTALSGRGVGLDVVRRNIEAIHGSVSVESTAGEGTTFRVRLPLTLAIVDGLGVEVDGESFVIPMEAVVEALRFSEGDPSSALRAPSPLAEGRRAQTRSFAPACGGEGARRADEGVAPTAIPSPTGVFNYRDETIPFIRLRQRLSLTDAPSERENVVIVRSSRGHAGLVVDDLDGECHTVVKPLPKALRGIPGLSGSAILPNGRIAFIVDVPGLLQVEIDRRGLHASRQEWSCSAN